MTDQPRSQTTRTIRVRIVVAIDQNKSWSAFGAAGYSDEQTKDTVFIDELADGEHHHWIEADVPVPVREHETVIAGDVTDAR